MTNPLTQVIMLIINIMDRDEIIAKAKTIFDESGLKQEEKDMWIKRFEGATTDEIEMLVDHIERDPELLPLATKNLAAKLDAIGNPEKFAQIAKEERESLEEALNN